MTGIFGILKSSATQWYQDVAPTQDFFEFSLSPTSQSLEVEQQIRIFGIAKSNITNVFMLELTH